jgi:hypothetical protein
MVCSGALSCGEKGSYVRRRLAVWLIGSALLATVVFLVGCAVSTTVTPIVAAKHVAFPAGQACDASGCHTPQYFHPTFTHKEPYLGPCQTCHNLVDWKQVTYKHKDATFDNGMHPLIGCAMCHTEGQPLPTGGCGTCHDAPHGGWTSCGSCHTTVAWRLFKPLPANHLSLAGGHSKLVCTDCHKTAKEPAVPRQCVDCHGTNHGGLRNCQDCHNPARGWKPNPNFNHSSFFKLVGFHRTLECGQCHKNGKFAGTPRVCVGCHGKQHGGLTDCASCHNTTAFIPSTFEHSSVFALTGQHAKLDCSRCHPKDQFARVIGGGSHRCVACHGTQHGGLSDCARCHTTAGFERTTFKHSSVFPLIGQHAVLAAQEKCFKCHPDNRFAVVAGTHCVDCHGADSPHGAGITQCQTCHTPFGFNLVITPFAGHPIPLAGHHAGPSCTDCHTSLVFSNPTRACSACHVSGPAVVVIPHVGPTDCLSCHWPTTWSDTHFTHPVIQNFDPSLPSPHDSTAFGPYPAGCANCHPGTGGNPDFTSFSCAECH